MNTLSIILLSTSLSFFSGQFFVQDPKAKEEGLATKSVPARKGGTLEVNIDPGSVEISTWDREEVRVEAEDIDERHPERLKVTSSDNAVHLEYADRRRSGRGPRFLVNVPVEFNVDVRTTGGNAIVNDRLKGNFKVDTDGGNVEMDEIIGLVDIHSRGGTIKADRIEGNATLQTNGGNVTVKMTTGELSVESGGGNIKIDDVGKKLKISTGGGNIALGDIGADTEVQTGGGNLHIGNLSSSARLVTGGGNVDVKGATNHVYLKTGGGNVKMKKIQGTLELTTGGGDVSVELTPTGKGESTIASGGGDVSLYVPENAKATIEAQVRVRQERGSRYRKKIDVKSDYKADKFDKVEDEINARYVLNGGGDLIAVETTNGVIEIRKLR